MKQRTKIFLLTLVILVLTVGAVAVDLPKGPDLKLGSFSRELKLHLGLDLQGGTQLTYDADLSKVATTDYETALASVRDVIERRVNAFGVSEPVVQTSTSAGKHRLIVELAGITNVQDAINLIGQTPLLEFREPSGKTSSVDTSKLDPSNPDDLKKIIAAQDEQFAATRLTGADLKTARVEFDQQTGQPQVSLQFNSAGTKTFADITKKNIGKQIAIFLDGEVLSAPVVNTAITDGQAVITGQFTVDEAKQLAQRLNAGALPVPIQLVSQQTVDASLGKVAIEKSLLAGLIGVILISLFMLLYYRFLGLMAIVGLLFYALINVALFKLIPVTLTLSGIAGFILSLGIAVDANVLIFERMKEEFRFGGATLSHAIDQGFRYAWPSIRDSNLSTLISCAILWWFGTSIVKGFALTLGLGVVAGMFSAIIVVRLLLRLVEKTPLKKSRWIFNAPTTPKGEKHV